MEKRGVARENVLSGAHGRCPPERRSLNIWKNQRIVPQNNCSVAHADAEDAQIVIIHTLKLPMRGCPLSRQCGCKFFGHDKRHGKSCDPRQRGAACAPILFVTELRTAGFLARRGVSTMGRPTLRRFDEPMLLQQISSPANVSQQYTTNAIRVIARHHTVSRMHTVLWRNRACTRCARHAVSASRA